MKIDGAIFDLDGTLLNSMPIWKTIGEQYLRSHGIEPRENLYEKFKNMSLYQAACYYQTEYGLTNATEEIIKGINAMIEHFYIYKVLPKEGVMEFLARLQQQGIKMCIATATDKHLVEAALKRNKMLTFFEEIFTCNAIGYGKDEPYIFDAAHAFLGTNKNSTWVFEDALYAIRTAKIAGFPVAAVYDESEKDRQQVLKKADVFIYSFEEMRDYLA